MKFLLIPLALLLSGCANEYDLVGHWRVVSGHACDTQCSFNIMPVAYREEGYHLLFDDPGSRYDSGRVIDVGWGHYRILSHNGDIPLQLKDGKFYHPWGWVFEKDEPYQLKSKK